MYALAETLKFRKACKVSLFLKESFRGVYVLQIDIFFKLIISLKVTVHMYMGGGHLVNNTMSSFF